MTSEIEQILDWFKAAMPNPTDENLCVQIGVLYEEIGEMATALDDTTTYIECRCASRIYKSFGGENDKSGIELWCPNHTLSDSGKEDLLDALCDQIVAAIGIGYMAGFDMAGALQEVIRSNASKFENGKPLFDENGKIRKGKDYTQPDLARFINKKGEE